jgi:uncharacterized repeat protein (TIGR03847 family)
VGESYQFDEVDFITAGAVGLPGSRTFFLQAEKAGERVAFVAEKGQVRSLAQLAQDLLAQVGAPVTPDDLHESAQRLREPIDPVWRAGAMSLGMDEAAERFVLEIEEAPFEEDMDVPGFARLSMNRDQLRALAAHAAYAVEAGARQTCELCGNPMEVEGHACPTLNGHGPPSR